MVKKETIIRTVVMVIALVNQGLLMFNKEVLPWSTDEIYEGLSYLATVCSTIWAWWKNNSFTKAAIEGDKHMEAERLKG